MCDSHVDVAEFCNETTRRARKTHVCCACGETIRVGDRYVYITGKWDEIETYKQCARCARVTSLLIDHLWTRQGYWQSVPFDLDCGADPLTPGEDAELDALAFATRDELQPDLSERDKEKEPTSVNHQQP